MGLVIIELQESRKVTINAEGMSAVRVLEVGEALNGHPTQTAANIQTNPETVAPNLVDPETGKKIYYGAAHPTLGNRLVVKDIRVEPMDTHCRATISYGPLDDDTKEDPNKEVWEWDWSAQTTHITSVRGDDTFKQVHYPVWADCGSAIGVDGEDVKGVDVYRPTGKLRVTRRFEGCPTKAVRRALMERSSCVNAQEFGGMAAGEVLFIGATLEIIQGVRLSSDPTGLRKGEYRVIYNFLVTQQQPPINVQLADGTLLQNIVIPPWDYIWYRHTGAIKGGTKQGGGTFKIKATGIESVHVAKVYASAAFAGMGINTVPYGG